MYYSEHFDLCYGANNVSGLMSHILYIRAHTHICIYGINIGPKYMHVLLQK